MSIYTEHFETVFGIKQNIQTLRNKVLELAIQGELVEQDPNDELASELVKKINAERETLVKEGKIKKQSFFEPIYEHEIPFDVPSKWEWVRLGEIADFIDYRGKTPKKTESGIPLITAKNIKLGYINKNPEEFIDESDFDNWMTRGLPDYGNLIFTTEAPLGNVARLNISGKYALAQRAIVFKTHVNEIDSFLFIALLSGLVRKSIFEKATGTTVLGIKASELKKIAIPLPPIHEQGRIVIKVESLMSQIDKLEQYLERKERLEESLPPAVVSAISNCQSEGELRVQLGLVIEHFNEIFRTPEALQELRNVILQLAIQGKLVSQSAADEPASELLSRIQAEKELLIKEKKTKKEKVLPEIEDAEIPFEIPSSWEWVRLGEIGQIVGGGTPKSNVSEYWADNGIPWVTPADLSNNKNLYVSKGRRDISEKGLLESSATLLPEGTVLFSSRAPIGYTAIAQNNISTNQGFKSIVPYVVAMNQYIYYFMKWDTPRINESATGTTFKEVSGQLVSQLLVPLPPLDEQHRIVRKIVSLFTVIDKLEKEMKRKQLIVKAMATV